MTDWAEYDSVEAYVADNRERLERVVRHSNDPYARACAWTILDAGTDQPELERLQEELERLQEGS